MTKKKRQRRITVLLIPDDNAEPYSFRLSWMVAKVLMVVAAILVLHMLGGGIGYWQFLKVSKQNSDLERSNTRLLEDNKRVYQLAAKLEAMDQDQSKIMSLLGVDERNGNNAQVQESVATSAPQFVSSSNRIDSYALGQSSTTELKNRNLMLKRRNSKKASPSLPILLPVEGFLSEKFSRSPWYPFKSHAGIDIAAKRGSVVAAAGDGTVVYSGWHNELGNLLILHHGESLFSRYGHNDRLLVREGTFVKRGDPIALVGSSGRSSGPHLHFEIWKDGVAVDPRDYLLAFRSAKP